MRDHALDGERADDARQAIAQGAVGRVAHLEAPVRSDGAAAQARHRLGEGERLRPRGAAEHERTQSAFLVEIDGVRARLLNAGGGTQAGDASGPVGGDAPVAADGRGPRGGAGLRLRRGGERHEGDEEDQGTHVGEGVCVSASPTPRRALDHAPLFLFARLGAAPAGIAQPFCPPGRRLRPAPACILFTWTRSPPRPRSSTAAATATPTPSTGSWAALLRVARRRARAAAAPRRARDGQHDGRRARGVRQDRPPRGGARRSRTAPTSSASPPAPCAT